MKNIKNLQRVDHRHRMLFLNVAGCSSLLSVSQHQRNLPTQLSLWTLTRRWGGYIKGKDYKSHSTRKYMKL